MVTAAVVCERQRFQRVCHQPKSHCTVTVAMRGIYRYHCRLL